MLLRRRGWPSAPQKRDFCAAETAQLRAEALATARRSARSCAQKAAQLRPLAAQLRHLARAVRQPCSQLRGRARASPYCCPRCATPSQFTRRLPLGRRRRQRTCRRSASSPPRRPPTKIWRQWWRPSQHDSNASSGRAGWHPGAAGGLLFAFRMTFVAQSFPRWRGSCCAGGGATARSSSSNSGGGAAAATPRHRSAPGRARICAQERALLRAVASASARSCAVSAAQKSRFCGAEGPPLRRRSSRTAPRNCASTLGVSSTLHRPDLPTGASYSEGNAQRSKL